MQHTPAPLLDVIAGWAGDAQTALWQCRTVFHATAAEQRIGPLTESLKWGQPAWRPQKARTGSTLRMGWSPRTPHLLDLYVDCKTDLAARMQQIYPEWSVNDGRRHLAMSLNAAFPRQAVSHLAAATFCYHLSRRDADVIG